uniref:THD domain-containing protein n=1 Tax=Anabas testudineus TaxID=64144 RepID=A0A3Q1IWZ8_ANATE
MIICWLLFAFLITCAVVNTCAAQRSITLTKRIFLVQSVSALNFSSTSDIENLSLRNAEIIKAVHNVSSLLNFCLFSTAGSEVVHEDQIVHWRVNDSLLHEMEHKDGRLVAKKGGFYHVYSLVTFECNDKLFYHKVFQTNPHYPVDFSLMSESFSQRGLFASSSYLSGVFHLCKGCYVFVKVSNTSNISQISTDTFFGAVMI